MLSHRTIKALRQYANTTDPRDVARARIVEYRSDARPGPYKLLPVIGWIRAEGEGRSLVLSCIMLRQYDDRHMGTLGWTIPINIRTGAQVLRLLAALGWDGRIWPDDAGWPDDVPEREGLKTMLRDARLSCTMVFPPDLTGTRVLRVNILTCSTDFPLEPLVPAQDVVGVTQELRAKFRDICQDPSVFLL